MFAFAHFLSENLTFSQSLNEIASLGFLWGANRQSRAAACLQEFD